MEQTTNKIQKKRKKKTPFTHRIKKVSEIEMYVTYHEFFSVCLWLFLNFGWKNLGAFFLTQEYYFQKLMVLLVVCFCFECLFVLRLSVKNITDSCEYKWYCRTFIPARKKPQDKWLQLFFSGFLFRI